MLASAQIARVDTADTVALRGTAKVTGDRVAVMPTDVRIIARVGRILDVVNTFVVILDASSRYGLRVRAIAG